jgi:peptidoglycan/LPS O-acetylase OafA/YrhL
VIWLASPRALKRLCISVIIVVSIAKIAAPLASIDPMLVGILTPFKLDTLCFGALLALWYREADGIISIARARRILLLLGAAILVVGFVLQTVRPSSLEVGRLLRATAVRAILAFTMTGALIEGPRSLMRRALESPVMRFFGKYSYGLYVFHAIVGLAVTRAHIIEKFAARLGSVDLALISVVSGEMALSIGLALLSYHLFEQRFLELKDRLAPRHPST